MRKALPILLLGFAFLVPSVPTSADPIIAVGHIGDNSGFGSGAIVPGSPGEFFMSFPWHAQNSGPELFNIPVPANRNLEGHTFRADGSDPNFANAVSVLTNGNDDYIGFGLRIADGVWSTGVLTETGLLGRAFGSSPPDLAGAEISAIVLHFNTFARQDRGVSRSVEFTATLLFEGTRRTPAATPEPATLLLLGSALAGTLVTGRRRRT